MAVGADVDRWVHVPCGGYGFVGQGFTVNLGAHGRGGPLHGGKGEVIAGAAVGVFVGPVLLGIKGLRLGCWGVFGFLCVFLRKRLTSGCGTPGR